MDIMIRPQLVLAISFLYNMSYDEALEFIKLAIKNGENVEKLI